MCCFEHSPLPHHRGARILVLRVVKITSPVVDKDVMGRNKIWSPKPSAGMLAVKPWLSDSTHPVIKPPWEFNVDAYSQHSALRGLFRDGGRTVGVDESL